MKARVLAAGVVTLATALATSVAPAAAQAPAPAPPKINWALDGGITAASLVGVGLLGLWKPPMPKLWECQLLPFDDGLKGRISASAAHVSDVLLGVEMVMPFALFVAGGLDEDTGRRSLIYGETLGLSLLANGIVKAAVNRPRPYLYSDDARVVAYAQAEGVDSHLSFYSGHASTTFAAAVAGSYLFAQQSQDENARALVWGFSLGTAAATATLRTRAGKHFYSDVLVGAVVGAGFGLAVPYLHGGTRPRLSRTEGIVIATAPVAGVLLAALPRWKRDLPVRLEPSRASRPLRLAWLPFVAREGAGLAAFATF